MGRTLQESRISTRSLRVGLPVGLYWRGVDPDIHLGYRKGIRGGKWVVRYYVPERATYRRIPLGTADDIIVEGTLSYDAAMRLARDKVEKLRRGKSRDDIVEPLKLTVETSVRNYIRMKDDRISAREGRVLRSDSSYRLELHVLSDAKFSSVRLERLTEDIVVGWRTRISAQYKSASLQRLINDFKAALNATFRDYSHVPRI